MAAATSETIDRPAPTEAPTEAWHALTGQQVAETLHVDPAAGLSGEEVGLDLHEWLICLTAA